MDVHRAKPPLSSPTFEKLNLERLKQAEESTKAANSMVRKSVELVHHSRELIRHIRENKRTPR